MVAQPPSLTSGRSRTSSRVPYMTSSRAVAASETKWGRRHRRSRRGRQTHLRSDPRGCSAIGRPGEGSRTDREGGGSPPTQSGDKPHRRARLLCRRSRLSSSKFGASARAQSSDSATRGRGRSHTVGNDDAAAAALIPADAIRILAVRISDDIVEGPWRPAALPLCDEPAIVLYTSGSTGEPKGIVLSQAGVLWRVRNGIVGDLSQSAGRGFFLSLRWIRLPE